MDVSVWLAVVIQLKYFALATKSCRAELLSTYYTDCRLCCHDCPMWYNHKCKARRLVEKHSSYRSCTFLAEGPVGGKAANVAWEKLRCSYAVGDCKMQ